ncbi:MAG: hypothetical protein RL757_248 [Bacteroidota bacterium]|jgi:hypothetical protein
MSKKVPPFQPLVRELKQRTPTIFQNRYGIALLVFLIFLLADKANPWQQFKLSRTVKRLEADRKYYQEKLKEVSIEKVDVEANPERFAREQYFMKAPDEDVFVVEKAENIESSER